MSHKKNFSTSKQSLANFLLAIAKGEREIEFLRQRLCENEEFEIYSAFQRIKKEAFKKTLTTKDFHYFLLSADRSVFEREIDKLVRHYDMDFDGEINFSEEIKFLQTLESLVAKNNSEPYEKMTALNIFLATGARSTGQLDFDCLIAFFRSLAMYPYEEDVICILRRIDKANEGRIVIEDLRNFLIILEQTIETGYENLDKRAYFSQGQGDKLRSFTPDTLSKKRKEQRHISSTVKKRNFEGMEQFLSRERENKVPYYRSTDLKNLDLVTGYSNKYKQLNESSTEFGTKTHWSTNFTNKYKGNEFEGTPEREKLFDLGVLKTAEFILSAEKPPSSLEKSKLIEGSRKTAMIVNFLRKIATLDQEVERAKQELALKIDFNVLDCFKVFDKNNQGSITSNEMEETLIEVGVQIGHNDLLLLFVRYDGDGDGKMRYTDFMTLLTPRLSEFSDLLLNRETGGVDCPKSTKIFSKATLASLANLFQKHFKIENEIEDYRRTLSSSIDSEEFDDIFKDLDSNQTGNLTTRELEKTFQKYNLPMIRRDFSAIMERFDSNRDGRISFTEFLEEISPKIPSGFF